jgi:hypothetical protein
MKKFGNTNHVRFTVSDIPRAEAFYDPPLCCWREDSA